MKPYEKPVLVKRAQLATITSAVDFLSPGVVVEEEVSKPA